MCHCTIYINVEALYLQNGNVSQHLLLVNIKIFKMNSKLSGLTG